MSGEIEGTIEKSGARQRKGHRATGMALSATGFLWLAKKAGWMLHETGWSPPHATNSLFLPLVLIASGLLLIFGLGGHSRTLSK